MAFGRKRSTKSSRRSEEPASSGAADAGSPGSKARSNRAPAKPPAGAGLVAILSDPKRFRRLLATVALAGPMLSSVALKSSAGIRGAIDQRRARQLGVSPDDVAAFRGPTGLVSARLEGLSASVDDLRARRSGDPAVVAFSDEAVRRLSDLATATAAAASMPAGRRKTTLRAVSRDLDRIDTDLMTFLVEEPAP